MIKERTYMKKIRLGFDKGYLSSNCVLYYNNLKYLRHEEIR